MPSDAAVLQEILDRYKATGRRDAIQSAFETPLNLSFDRDFDGVAGLTHNAA